MDLSIRKYHLIQELVKIEKESILSALENLLKEKKNESEGVSNSQKQILNERLESYNKNPDDLVNWESVKHEW